jgi:cyanophycin synthetase
MVKLVDSRALRGANYYSYRPVVVLTLDLGEYDEVFTNDIPGFVDTLLELVPSLEEHRCSEMARGGLVKRMREGTLLGHVIEHLALELQYIAGMEVGFGKTIDTDEPGVYQVIYSFWVEEAGIVAGERAIDLVNALLEGRAAEVDPEDIYRELEDISADHYLGPSTAAIVEEADRRGITVLRLDDYNLVQLGEGKYQRRIEASITSQTSMIGVETAGNKRLTKQILSDAGIPVPKGTVVRKVESAIEDAEWLGYPVVVKPHDGHHGKGVTTNIADEADVREAFARAKEISEKVIVEKCYVGHDYRMLVVDGRFVAAAMREPAAVAGDGEHTIAELIAIANRDPRRGYGHERVMTRLSTSSVTQYLLERAGYTLETVLPDGEVFALELTANLSTGGSAVDVTDGVHKANRFMAERIAGIVGLDIAGIDVIAPTLEQPVKKVGGAVIEVNAAPGLRMHLEPAEGRRRNVAAPIIDMLFPKGTPHDIVIVAVTGTNGKTTTVRLIAHIMEHAGYSVGMTTTDGVYVRGNLIAEGDMSGPYSAQVVLRDPLVDCAVLETARGGILRSGLGYKTADVGVVLNVQPDHLGLQNIRDLDELAKVKAVVAEAVRPGGTTVLNADDPKCVEMTEYCRESVVFFALRASNPVVVEHVDRGNAAVVCEQGYIAVVDGDHLVPVARVDDVPLTMGGKATFNVQNALAATAAAFAYGVDVDEIRRGLISFLPSPLQTPGRLNLVTVGGVDYLIDYAHNPHAYRNLLDLVVQLGDRRRSIVFDVVGDRRDEDIEEVCRLVAPVFDAAILYEAADLRGREPGELMALQERFLAAAGFDPAAIESVGDEMAALRFAAGQAQAGDLVCYMTGRVQDGIQCLNALAETGVACGAVDGAVEAEEAGDGDETDAAELGDAAVDAGSDDVDAGDAEEDAAEPGDAEVDAGSDDVDAGDAEEDAAEADGAEDAAAAKAAEDADGDDANGGEVEAGDAGTHDAEPADEIDADAAGTEPSPLPLVDEPEGGE